MIRFKKRIKPISYDANGNVSARNGNIISWTSYNYPDSVGTSTESATFDYGPDRHRWRMVYSGPSGVETTYYATPTFEAVASGGGMDYRHYIYANGRPVLVISHTNTGAVNVRSLLLDQQGSISTIAANATGASYATESFTPYGNRREASTWSGPPTSGELTTMNGVTREGYTFQTVLGSMGLNHMNGRIEDSITGRFLSPDPRGIIKSNTQSWNRYSYVVNNPVTFVDPSGFGCVTSGDGSITTCDSGGSDGGTGGSPPTIVPGPPMTSMPVPNVDVFGNTCPTSVVCNVFAPPDNWPLTPSLNTGAAGIQGVTVTAPAIKPKTPPPPQQIPCLPGADCYIPSVQSPIPTVQSPKLANPGACARYGIGCHELAEPLDPCEGGFINQTNQQFKDTQATLPGVLAPPGLSFLTSRALSNATGLPTIGDVAVESYQGGRLTLSVEFGLYHGALNFAAAGSSFEFGLYAGSMMYVAARTTCIQGPQ